MPTFNKGDLFEAPGIHIVGASSSISQDDTLVMGIGAPYAMKRRYPEAPKIFGSMIKDYCGNKGVFGLLLYGRIGILQSRLHFNDKINLPLLIYGVKILGTVAEGRQSMVYNLTHPGLGYDKSINPEIESLLAGLPENVHIWQRG